MNFNVDREFKTEMIKVQENEEQEEKNEEDSESDELD